MNILILTPIHPTQIEEMGYLYSQWGEVASIASPQMLALVWSESTDLPYAVTNNHITNECKKKPKELFKQYDKPNLIVFGNIDKNTKIKFDYILAYTSHFSEDETCWDLYLREVEKRLDNTDVERVEWFDKTDAEYIFPTLYHLNLFLQTILKVDTNANLQSKTN